MAPALQPNTSVLSWKVGIGLVITDLSKTLRNIAYRVVTYTQETPLAENW